MQLREEAATAPGREFRGLLAGRGGIISAIIIAPVLRGQHGGRFA